MKNILLFITLFMFISCVEENYKTTRYRCVKWHYETQQIKNYYGNFEVEDINQNIFAYRYENVCICDSSVIDSVWVKRLKFKYKKDVN